MSEYADRAAIEAEERRKAPKIHSLSPYGYPTANDFILAYCERLQAMLLQIAEQTGVVLEYEDPEEEERRGDEQ